MGGGFGHQSGASSRPANHLSAGRDPGLRWHAKRLRAAEHRRPLVPYLRQLVPADLDDTAAADRRGDLDCQASPCEVIHHPQQPHAPAVLQRVEQEVEHWRTSKRPQPAPTATL